ncbi:glycosyltransferase family 4 protein [Brachybacterium tyrofermentans]|uniref:glycosyltransferase family 4 protein n=1 Tax=Brachybacterium tyrofermentans TaxID=47848 RepID=UPI003FD4DDE9
MPSPRDVVRNARLLLQSAAQHLVDDPALLVVQVSRRLPFRVRVGAGRALRTVAGAILGGEGTAALGAFMAGDMNAARELITAKPESSSRMRGEVAVLLERFDLLTSQTAPATRARAAWTRGNLSDAVEILNSAGQGGSRYARRLRSELQLLEPGYRLPVSVVQTSAGTPPVEGEPLRILHVLTNSLPHTQSGYSLRSHRILTALREQGTDSVALTRTGYPVMVGKLLASDEDVVDGIRYVRSLPAQLAQTQEERLLAEVRRAIELVEQFRPHVLHATTNYHNALVVQAVAAATGLPWVLEVRGLMEKTWIASHPSANTRHEAASSEKARLVSAREAELATSANAVVTLSGTMATELTARGVDPEAVTVVPNGVDEALLSGHLTAVEARGAVGMGMTDVFAIGAVSALVDYEGFDTLLRAAALLIHDVSAPSDLRDRLHVVLAGDGAAAPGLRALASELGISERVTMPGRVPRHSARHWVQALDVVVVPRHDVEVARVVTPQKPVEAMALARPVIISDLPALRETVATEAGGSCAVTFPAGSAADLAVSIRSVFAGEGPDIAAGREVAAARVWTSLVRRYDTIYRHALAQTQEERTRG